MRLVNDIEMFGIYPEDNDDSLKSFKKGDQICPLARSLCQQCGGCGSGQGTSEVGLFGQTYYLAKEAKGQVFLSFPDVCQSPISEITGQNT